MSVAAYPEHAPLDDPPDFTADWWEHARDCSCDLCELAFGEKRQR